MLVNDLFEAQFRQPRIMYHGTSSRFLHGILKNGLVPKPVKKRWDTDAQESPHSFSRVSLPGSYWASNLMTAKISAGNTTAKFGGTALLIIAQIAEQSAYSDEDNQNAPLMWAVSDTMATLHPQIRPDFWLGLASDLFDGDAQKRAKAQDVFAEKLHKHLKGSEHFRPDRMLCNELLDVLVKRNMAFEEKSYKGIVKSWMEHPPESFPSIQELEQWLLSLREKLTRSYRSSAFYSADKFNHTLRMPGVVGFSGSNRIRTIIEWPEYRSKNHKLPFVLLYGSADLPDDFMRQYRERIGSFPGLVDKRGKMLMPSNHESE